MLLHAWWCNIRVNYIDKKCNLFIVTSACHVALWWWHLCVSYVNKNLESCRIDIGHRAYTLATRRCHIVLGHEAYTIGTLWCHIGIGHWGVHFYYIYILYIYISGRTVLPHFVVMATLGARRIVTLWCHTQSHRAQDVPCCYIVIWGMRYTLSPYSNVISLLWRHNGRDGV